MRWIRTMAAATLAVAALTTCVDASPISQEMVKQGLQSLRAQDYVAAEETFARAILADPKDGTAAFMRGFALNRLERHSAALASLDYAVLNGVADPQLDYETGWAAVATGDWQRAAASLERYQAARSGNAKASEFLGRAYLGLGQLDRAEAKLNEAIRQDPSLAPTAQLALAQVQARRGELTAAEATLDTVARGAPGTAVGETARQVGQQVARERLRQKPWNAYAGFAMGHDSNVVALSDTIVRPEEITNRDSHFARFNAGADYTATLAPTTIVTFAYNGQYDSYFSVDGQDTLDNSLYATLRHALFRELAGSVTVSGQQAYQDGDSAYTGYGFRPAVQFQPYRWLGFEAYVGWSDSDYPAPNTTPDVLNRDSVTRTYGLTAFAALPEEVAFVEIGIARMDNGAKGSDFDFQASRVHVGVIVPLPWQLTADGRLTFTDYDYENLNSLAPTTPPGPVAFAFTRQDQVAEVSLRLGRPILENLLGYVQYQKTDADSNLPVYEYDQWSLTGGIVYRF